MQKIIGNLFKVRARAATVILSAVSVTRVFYFHEENVTYSVSKHLKFDSRYSSWRATGLGC